MYKSRIKYERNSHQKDFQDDTHSKYLTLVAGFASGKTHGLVMKLFQLSRLNAGFDGGLFCPSIPDYKKDILPLMESILDENKVRYRYHKTDKWWRFPWSSGVLQVFTCEKPIRGPNLAYAGINEITLISSTSFKEIVGRVRVKGAPCPQIVGSGTPEGTNHWLYEKFIDQPMKGSRIIHGSTRDNAHNLSPDYIESLQNSYDKQMLDAYLEGMFINMNSRRFYYAYAPHKNQDKTLTRIPDLEVHVSLDYNVSPMCATMWHLVPRFDLSGRPLKDGHGAPLLDLLGFDQIEIADGADTNQMCDALIARGYHPDTTTIYPDPAGNKRSTQGPPDNEILKSRGFHKIRVRLAAPRFRQRQLNVNNLLDKVQIKFNPITCLGIKRDFEGVEQDAITLEKLKTNPKLTHYSDGVDYLCDIIFQFSGSKPDSRSIKFR